MNPTNTALTTRITAEAMRLHAAGLTVIPITMPLKSPAVKSWKRFQTERPTDAELAAMFSGRGIATITDTEGIALICGKASGGIEVLDIDTKHDAAGTLYADFCERIEQFVPGLLERLTVQSTVSGGYHLIYRCTEPSGNQKIAMNPDNKCIIETRGEGGYIVIAPTAGYAVLAGDFTDAPIITADERAGLLDCACSFHVVKDADIVTAPVHVFTNGSAHLLTAGNDFNQRGDITPLLRIEGWTCVYERQGTQFWRRPGKRIGVSATFNYGGSGKFYVFSSNADPFDSGRAYNKFAVYTLLKHHGDFKAAAKDLSQQGFGERQARQLAAIPEQLTLDGEPDKTPLGKIEDYLLRRYDFRWNEITRRTEFRKKDTTAYATITQRDFGSICRELEHRKLKYALEKLQLLLESDFTPLYNPFTEYFAALPPHDGTDYIAQLAATVTVDDNSRETWQMYVRKWMVAHTATALGRGSNHTTLVMAGPQGVGKTTWLNRLVPTALNPDYLYVGTIDPENKDTLLLIAQKFIINLDELESLSKYEIGHLKTIMTRNHLDTRKAWGRFNETYRRAASFVGSVNKNQFLTDETGNRRFLVVNIESIDYQHSVDIDKCYAQALALLNDGYQYHFNTTEIATINSRNEEFVTTTVAAELLRAYYEPIEWEKAGHKMMPAQIAKAIADKARIQVTDIFSRNLGAPLRKLGFESRMIRGARFWAVKERAVEDNGRENDLQQEAPF